MSTVEEYYEGEITRTITRRTSFKIKEVRPLRMSGRAHYSGLKLCWEVYAGGGETRRVIDGVACLVSFHAIIACT